MRWIDAHTHLDMAVFDVDRAQVIERAADRGVTGFVLSAGAPESWDRVVAVAERAGMPWTLGVHPWWEAMLDEADWMHWHRALEDYALPHGVGETGLDWRRARSAKARQRQCRSLVRHLALARARNVPVVLHCVRAYGTLLDVIEAEGLPPMGGMVHSWSGAPELVRRAVNLGLHLSFSASALRSAKIMEAAKRTPDHNLLIETDCPDQAVVPGARGEPVDLLVVARGIAQARRDEPAALLDRSATRLRGLFPGSAFGVSSMGSPRDPVP